MPSKLGKATRNPALKLGFIIIHPSQPVQTEYRFIINLPTLAKLERQTATSRSFHQCPAAASAASAETLLTHGISSKASAKISARV